MRYQQEHLHLSRARLCPSWYGNPNTFFSNGLVYTPDLSQLTRST